MFYVSNNSKIIIIIILERERRGTEGERESQGCSIPRVEPEAGLNLTILIS